MESLSMASYYDCRKKIRSLYDNNINDKTGDLCSAVLQVRDKNKCVSSIKVDITGYSIDVEMEDDTPENKKERITSKIADKISGFIKDNRQIIPNIDQKQLDTILNSDNYLYCDISVVGNSIKFNL